MNISILRELLLDGLVIPACPLALDENRQWSKRHQTALTRYYFDAGAGGLAVGVHSTQFAIRNAEFNLFEPVLNRVSNEITNLSAGTDRPFIKIAGICGDTSQATVEAETAVRLGYHTGLVSMTALNDLPESAIVEHCKTISKVIPLFGFYLQPAVGGRVLSFEFWRGFCEIPNLVAIKIAPFNRYQTWDVVRAVIESGRDDVALYTGNDDNIIVDLLTPFSANANGQPKTRFINGGLLGQWGVWTSRAVAILDEIKAARRNKKLGFELINLNVALTDANAAIFDAAHSFNGCIPGILEILRKQGLVPTNFCLDPKEKLSLGQREELIRIGREYPELNDDDFVRENLERWMA